MKAKQNVIDDYLQAVEESIASGGDTQFWPFGPGQVDSYFIDLLAINFFEKFKQNPSKFKQALSLLPVSTLRWMLLPFTILGLKLAKNYDSYPAESEEMVNFIDAVRYVLEEKVSSDPFCLDRKNITLSEQETEKLINDLEWLDGKDKRFVNLLSINLESFVWAINFDLFAYSVYWHGPYLLTGGKMLLGKRFFDLNSPVWNLDSHYESANIYYQFNQPIDVSIDFMGHIVYKEVIWDKLETFAVEINGKTVNNPDEIKNLSEHFSQERDDQLQIVNHLSSEQMIKKGAEIYYYMFHKFFEFYKESWQPPEAFEKRLQEWGLKCWDEFKPKENGKEKPNNDFFRKLYDPRNTFTG